MPHPSFRSLRSPGPSPDGERPSRPAGHLESCIAFTEVRIISENPSDSFSKQSIFRIIAGGSHITIAMNIDMDTRNTFLISN
jgi:hypothetical protein